VTEFAVGVTVFMRTDRLRRLLESITHRAVSTVYVADVGDTDDRRDLYEREYPFDLVVNDLAYDAGVSRGRNSIVAAAEEDYLLFVDSDNEVPERAGVLAEQLENRPDVGGIAGSLIEPELGRIYQGACDLAEYDGGLVKSSRLERKSIEQVAGDPFVRFDFVPMVVMFRRTCLEDRAWDPELTNHKEHLDFFVGHWKHTEWDFGVCPTVFFEHYPGGSQSYTQHRFGDFDRQTERFREKWGYDHVKSPHGNWFDTHKVGHDPTMGPRDLHADLPMSPQEAVESLPQASDQSLIHRAYSVYKEDGLGELLRKSIRHVR
jgi:hypothetical protein